jgi:hypothetical protein
MVLVLLGGLQFEASKFETRTMPTPTMKGKEMIYWIKLETEDRRLVTDVERFLKGAPQYIELRVPSAFIVAKVELENYTPPSERFAREGQSSELSSSTDSRRLEQLNERSAGKGGSAADFEGAGDDRKKIYTIEIGLRRGLVDQPTKNSSQSPYG